MVNQVKYQVIIIGAGPAGCSAAIRAAEAGLSVMIIEARPFPRPRPGETLHPGIEPLFHELGVMQEISAANYFRPAGFFCIEKNKTEFLPYYSGNEINDWRGWLIPREDMDNYLLSRAMKLGVKLLQCRGQVKILSTDPFLLIAGLENFQCEYVLDATGHNFWLSRQLGHSIKRISGNLTSYYGVCEGEFSQAREAPSFYKEENSWTWVAELKPSLYQWSYLNYEGQQKEKNFQPELLRSMQPIGITRSRDVTWRIVSEPSGKNYFCLGDAAFVTDPSSSQGVLKAVMSGMMAAHLISHTINKKNLDPETASASYNEWIRSWFTHECDNLRKS
jgi:flavin-dependent dehydrogenase